MTRKTGYTAAGRAVTDLIIEVFRLNGRLLAGGDRLMAGIGLTSARWQVLGAIALSPAPAPVAHLARAMGLNRQGVQRIANEMAQEGFLVFQTNPNHQRAKLVALTNKGQKAFDAAIRLQMPWANALAQGLGIREITTANGLIARLRRSLED